MSEERFSRACPKCGVEMWYQTEKGMKHAESYRAVCKECRPKGIKRSATLRPDIIRLSAEGKNNVEIAIELGSSPATVSKILHENGLESSHDFGNLKGEWLDKLKGLFAEAKSNEEIAAELKMSAKTVNKYRKRLGYESKSYYVRQRIIEDTIEKCGEELLALHAKGRKTNTIAFRLKVSVKVVEDILHSKGLRSNACVRSDRVIPANEFVDENSMRCYKCGNVSHVGNFKRPRGQCKDCTAAARHAMLNNDMPRYFKFRLRDLKRRSLEKGVECSVTVQDLVDIFHEQDGKCFYTGEVLVPRVGIGYAEVRKSISVDKIIPEFGYVKDNTVLCTFRANTIKQDMNIKEMHYWFNPKIYEKVKNKVFNLLMEDL